MLTVGENTRLYPFIRWIQPMVEAGNRRYWVWESGIIPDGPGAWAENAPLPRRDEVWELFCAAVPNLALRSAGKKIPYRLNAPNDRSIDGGIAAYFDGVLGPGYFGGEYSDPLHMATARRWAENTRSGVLVGWPYRGSALAQQGHVGILLPSGYVLQSFRDPNGPDLNWNYTLEQFAWGITNAVMVHPANWIEYAGDLAAWAK